MGVKLKQVDQSGAALNDGVVWSGTSWIASPFAGGGVGNTGVFTAVGTVAVGDAVYSSGPSAVSIADADGPGTQPLIGLVNSLSLPSCTVQFYGEMSGFVGLIASATYYLSTTGVSGSTLTTVAPTAPGSIVQKVGFAKSSTVLVIMIDRDFVQL